MDVETSDILGGRLPVVRDGSAVSWSMTSKLYLVLGAGLALWLWWLRVGPYWRQYRETQYRKAMRRRHGIPDNDHRPFNVAYAAATRARQELEAEARRSRRASVDSQAQIHTSSQMRPAPTTFTKQRLSQIERQSTPPFQAQSYPVHTSASRINSRSHIGDTDSASTYYQKASVQVRDGRDRSGRRSRLSTLPAYGKHALEEEEDIPVDHEKESKKSRVEGNRQADGNENAGWDVDEDKESSGMEVDEDAYTAASPGSKQFHSGDEEDASTAGLGSKRLRKVSRSKSQNLVDPDQEMEDADIAHDLPSIPRGKKRDRGEAGSVFGGDESVLGEDEGKPRRYTRRRTASHKKTSVSSRGQKRGREIVDSLDSDEESAKPMKRTMRQRRSQQFSDDSDLSMDDGLLSHDPLCKGRRIGEEWEVNGILYKVGPNGQRLRQALVKRSRSRFSMPKDSKHPDRSANIDVFVETWLSDEQYQEAKERHELAWQESPRQTTAEPETPGDVPDITPAKSGKNLLWSSTMVDSPTAQRRPFRHSIVATVGLRVNPFDQSQAAPGRRISAVQSTPILPPDSPKLRSSKSYSKWEKQDLEAVAMAKLREKAQKQIAAPPVEPVLPGIAPVTNNAPEDKKEAVTAPSSNPSKVPAFSTPSETKTAPAAPPTDQPFSFGAKPPSVPEPSKAPSISFPSAPAAPAPSTITSSITDITTSSIPTAPVPSFSLGPPSTTKPAASASAPAGGSPSVPNFFGSNAAAPATSLIAPNPFAPKPPVAAPATSTTIPPPPAPASSTSLFAPKPQPLQQPTPAANGAPAAAQSNPAPATPAPIFSFKSSVPSASVSSSAQPSTSIFGNGQVAQSKPAESAPLNGFKLFGDAKNERPTLAESTSAPVGGSLFSRIGGPTSQPVAAAPSVSPATGASTNLFTFGKTAAPTAAAPTETKPAEANVTTSGAALAPIKFNFFGNAGSSNTVPTLTTANTLGTADPSVPGTAAPSTSGIFGGSGFTEFGNNTTTSTTPSSNAFGDSAPASSNPFGGSFSTAPATSSTISAAKPTTFAFGGSSSSSNTATNTAPASASAFGGSTSAYGSSTAATSRPTFGAIPTPSTSTTQPATQTQPTFGGFGSGSSPFSNGGSATFGGGTANVFGGTGSTPATSASKANETENKSVPFKFNFGAPSTSAPAAPTFGASGFGAPGFGAPAASGISSATPAASNGPAQPTLNAFGFGNPSSSTGTANTFSFGSNQK